MGSGMRRKGLESGFFSTGLVSSPFPGIREIVKKTLTKMGIGGLNPLRAFLEFSTPEMGTAFCGRA
jgi:hypothetical protein